MHLAEFNHLVLGLLWEIDQEATSVEGDYPTGLWWYVGHLDRERPTVRRVFNSEVQWSRRIAEVLNARGIPATTECRYPAGSRQRCDVVADIGLPKPLWLEVKGAWRAKFDPPVTPNTAYKKYLLSTARDIDKLRELPSDVASAYALVLVGFDRKNLPISREDLTPIRDKTQGGGWLEHRRQWDVRGRVAFRTRCWVWSRTHQRATTASRATL